MEAYFAAKKKLFEPTRTDNAVVNVDDFYGRRLAEVLRVPQVTVSLAGLPTADWRGSAVELSARESRAVALGPAGERVELGLRFPGAFNLANALGALAALVAVGVDAASAAAGLSAVERVPGRVERVEAGQPFTALVDYAHTPEAVRTLLDALRASTPGRLVVVLGCGGDRDRAKRPLMAAAAVAGADLAVFTSDNPRSEDPLAILAEMTAGLPAGQWTVEPDRTAAIELAVAALGPGDTVVVAGKGHEDYQDIAGQLRPFLDREALRSAIGAAGARA
jgi:UDP-N-acetylmuramoyl-L-alanyl-D-glutamate--2,6-diaminopimelate ligase